MSIKQRDGFTLVELSLVMLIFGMLISTFLLGLKLYRQTGTIEQTRESIEKTESATAIFRIVHGRLPCPARLDLAPDDANYGREDCAGVATATSVGRDADGDGNDDTILIGGVPFNTFLDTDPTIGIPLQGFYETHGYDGWGRKLTYAVSELMTDNATFNESRGAIDVVDEHGETVLEKEKTAHAVIVSHGPNGIGGYTVEGNLVENCALGITIDTDSDGEPDSPSPEPAVNSVDPDETENCDENDGRFINGLQSDNLSSYNDDIVTYLYLKTSAIWQYTGLVANDNGTPADPSDDFFVPQVANTNPGNIGIGVDNPSERLEVSGDLLATEIRADYYCDENGEDCLTAEAIAGSGIHCDDGEVVTGIENNDVVCAPAFSEAIVDECPPGEFAVGLSSLNGLICEAL